MSTHPSHCPHCHARAPKSPNRLLANAVVGAAWLVGMASVFGGILTGPFIIALLPILAPAGIAAITAAHSWAYADLECDACGKTIIADGELLPAIVKPAPVQDEPAIAA